MSDLSVIDPEPTVVEFRGKKVSIRPLRVGQLPQFARAVAPMAGALTAAMDNFGPGQFLDLLAAHGDRLIEAVAIGSGVSRTEIEASDPAELLALAMPIVKVNADFFGRRLIPALAAMRQPEPSGDGLTPSTA